jgi:hypothetical protein
LNKTKIRVIIAQGKEKNFNISIEVFIFGLDEKQIGFNHSGYDNADIEIINLSGD